MANINNLDPSLLNIDKVIYKKNNTVIYDSKYFKNLNCSNPLYLFLIM